MSDIHEQTAKLLDRLQAVTAQAQILATHRPKAKPGYYEAAQELLREAEPLAPVLEEFQENLPSVHQPHDAPDTRHTGNTNHTHTAPANLPADNSYSPIGFELWEALAYDLALDHTDRQTIAEAYRLSIPQLEHLEANPYFGKMLQAKRDEIKQIGSDAAFVVKMRMVANRATPQFLKRLTDSSTSSKDFHALFKTAVELAQLMPKQDEDTNVAQAVIGASVTFNIQGVPGLEHLSAAPARPVPAPVQTDDPEEGVTDADWEDVIEHQNTKLSADDPDLVEL